MENAETITNFSTFGSCASRNIFYSKINKNYKNFFQIHHSVESVNLISLMSTPTVYDSKLVNSPDRYDNVCVTEDLTKNYLDFLKKDSEVDYLIMDTYFDVVYDIILINKNTIISNSWRLKKTELYNQLKNYKKMNIIENFDEYFSLWQNACDRFFKFIGKNQNDIKIILNCARAVSKYCDDGKISYDTDNEFITNKKNMYRNILDKYILENFDVEALPFDRNVYGDKNHIFGPNPMHYESKYYTEKTNQLNEIIRRNSNMQFDNDYNYEIRSLKRKCLINEFKLDNLNNIKTSKYNDLVHNFKLTQLLSKYNTARIDIKNNGSPNNNIKILENSDISCSIKNPNWFKNELGIGTQILSKANSINLKIKCIKNGELKIMLKGIDFKNENKKRIPIYIKYTSLKINNKEILKNPVTTYHDKPFVYTINVEDSDVLNISIKWIVM